MTMARASIACFVAVGCIPKNDMKYCANTMELVALNLSHEISVNIGCETARLSDCGTTHDRRTVVTANDMGTSDLGRGYACSRYTTSAPDRSGNMLASSVYSDNPALIEQ